MKRSCFRAGQLLQQRAAGLSSAAGLELEEHLHECADCRAAANLLDGLRALDSTGVPELTIAQRENAIARALDRLPQRGLAASDSMLAERLPGAPPRAAAANENDPGQRAQTRRRIGRVARWVAVPALAAVVLLGVMRSLQTRVGPTAADHPGSASGRRATATTGQGSSAEHAAGSQQLAATGVATEAGRASLGDRVLAGWIERDRARLEPGSALTGPGELASEAGASLALGHAIVQLRAASRMRWDAAREQIELLGGSVEVAVDRSQKRRFSVRTAKFSAIVLGTVFEVTTESVLVREGRVQITDRRGRPLARLDAERRARFSLEARPAATSEPSPDPSALLDQAREQIAANQLAAARGSLARALSLPISQDLRDEARSLQAECALVAGEYAAARDSYLSVVHEFPSLSAGQTALFAAARIESQHGNPTRASELFQRYLDQYPHGQFAREAAARLKAQPTGRTP